MLVKLLVVCAVVGLAVFAEAKPFYEKENNFRFRLDDSASPAVHRVRRSADFSHPLHLAHKSSAFRSALPQAALSRDSFLQPRYIRMTPTRRTLPFQLVPQLPMRYSHNKNFVDDRGARTLPRQMGLLHDDVNDQEENQEEQVEEEEPVVDLRNATPEELLAMLEKLNHPSQRHRVRFGFF